VLAGLVVDGAASGVEQRIILERHHRRRHGVDACPALLQDALARVEGAIERADVERAPGGVHRLHDAGSAVDHER
jgi:hypothetical protein